MSRMTDAVSRARARTSCVRPAHRRRLRLRRRSSSPSRRSPPGRSTDPGRCCSWSPSRSRSPRPSPPLARRRRWGGWRGRRVCWRSRSSSSAIPLAVPSRLARRRRRPAPGPRRADQRRRPGLEGPRHGRAARRVVPQPARSRPSWCSWSGPASLLLLSWREDRVAYAAVPVAIGMTSFGLFFGRTTVSAAAVDRPGVPVRARRDRARPRDPAHVPDVAVVARRTRSGSSRSQRAATSERRARVSASRRGPIGVAPCLGAGHRRGRADRRRRGRRPVRGARCRARRAALGRRVPTSTSSAAISPLSEYRALFADARADEVLFTVVGAGGAARAGAPRDPRLLRRRGLSQRRVRRGGRGPLRAGAGRTRSRGRAAPSRPRSRSRVSTASGCRPSAGSLRRRSRAPGRRPSPTGSTTARPRPPGVQTAAGGLAVRGRVCRPRRRARRGGPRRDRRSRRGEHGRHGAGERAQVGR